LTLVSVLVPVYFNAETLPSLLDKLRGIAAELPEVDRDRAMPARYNRIRVPPMLPEIVKEWR
jgi:hypothetical protein